MYVWVWMCVAIYKNLKINTKKKKKKPTIAYKPTQFIKSTHIIIISLAHQSISQVTSKYFLQL